MEKLVENYGRGITHDAINLYKDLKGIDKTFDDLIEWWEDSKTRQPESLPTKQCPDCDSPMTPGSEEGFKHWYCKKCGKGLPFKETTNAKIVKGE